MDVTIEPRDLADAVTAAAHARPNRPPVPVMAGLLLTAHDDTEQLEAAGFDYEVAAALALAVGR